MLSQNLKVDEQNSGAGIEEQEQQLSPFLRSLGLPPATPFVDAAEKKVAGDNAEDVFGEVEAKAGAKPEAQGRKVNMRTRVKQILEGGEVDEVLAKARENVKQCEDALAESEAKAKALDVEEAKLLSDIALRSKKIKDAKRLEAVAEEKLKVASLSKAETTTETHKAAPAAASKPPPQGTPLFAAEQGRGLMDC